MVQFTVFLSAAKFKSSYELLNGYLNHTILNFTSFTVSVAGLNDIFQGTRERSVLTEHFFNVLTEHVLFRSDVRPEVNFTPKKCAVHQTAIF